MTTVAIVCSPNMGIVDSWLPVLTAARERHPDWTLVALVPRAWAIGIRPEAAAIRAADRVLDRVAVEVVPGEYRAAHGFADAERIRGRLSSVAEPLHRWRVSHRFRGPLAARAIRGAGRALALTAPAGRRLRLGGLRVSVLLMDPSIEDRPELVALVRALGDPPALALSHGLGYLVPAGAPRPPGHSRLAGVYAYSATHADQLAGELGLARAQVRVTGVPRHDPHVPPGYAAGDATDADADAADATGTVLVISRPATSPDERPGGSPVDWLPAGRKRAQLRAIHRVVCEERGLRLVVTLHPKEVDGREVREALPPEGEGRTWWLSEQHPLELAAGLRFAVSFSSGVAVDLLSADVPTIELQDVTGASAYDGPDALRDAQGRVLRTSERRHGLVLPADDEDDLRAQVARILDAPDATLAELRAAYRARYADPTGAVATILADIESLAAGRPSTEGPAGTDH